MRLSGGAEVTGTLTVNRSAYGMSWRPMKMAGLDVTIDVRLNYRKTSA